MPNTPRFPQPQIVQRYGIQPHEGSVRYLSGAGGFSGADFWRFSSEQQGELCLRRWPAGTIAARVAQVHAALFQAAAAGIEFLAVPFRDQRGQSFFEFDNRLTEVASWLAGSADFHATPSASRLQNAMSALAHFHNAVSRNSNPDDAIQVSPGVVHRQRRVAELLAGRLTQIENALASHREHELSLLAESILQCAGPRLLQLKTALDEAAQVAVPTQLCLRDVRHDHVLFVGDRVSGIVDYDAIRVDSVTADITRLTQGLVGNDRQQWKFALDAYTAMRPLDENESRLIPVLQSANPVLSVLTWLEWLFLERREFDDLRRVEIRLSDLAAQLD